MASSKNKPQTTIGIDKPQTKGKISGSSGKSVNPTSKSTGGPSIANKAANVIKELFNPKNPALDPKVLAKQKEEWSAKIDENNKYRSSNHQPRIGGHAN